MLSVSSATSTQLRRGDDDDDCDSNSITQALQRVFDEYALRNGLDCGRRHRDTLVQAVPLELPVERAAADAEEPRGDGLVAPHLLQRPDDVLALDLDERRRIDLGPRRPVRARRDSRRDGSEPLLLHASRKIALADEVPFG